MILKLLIDFYRWLWGMEPWCVQTVDETMSLLIAFGAMLDILAKVTSGNGVSKSVTISR